MSAVSSKTSILATSPSAKAVSPGVTTVVLVGVVRSTITRSFYFFTYSDRASNKTIFVSY